MPAPGGLSQQKSGCRGQSTQGGGVRLGITPPLQSYLSFSNTVCTLGGGRYGKPLHFPIKAWTGSGECLVMASPEAWPA